MKRCLIYVLVVFVFVMTGMAYAETCDAGNGCVITCKDGCSAIYNHDTGKCSKACGRAARSLAQKTVKKDSITIAVKGFEPESSAATKADKAAAKSQKKDSTSK